MLVIVVCLAHFARRAPPRLAALGSKSQGPSGFAALCSLDVRPASPAWRRGARYTASQVRHNYSRFLFFLILVDAVVVLVFGGVVLWKPPARASSGDAPVVKAGGTWGGVDAEALGREVGGLWLEARRALMTRAIVEVLPVEKVGDDVVFRLALKKTSKRNPTFPGNLYCSDCETQSCQFGQATRGAIDAMAKALPSASLRDLAGRVGPGRLAITFSGASEATPIEPSEEETHCVGSNTRTFGRELGFDKYTGKCGSHACVVGGKAERVGNGDIDEAREVACLRAFCVHRMSSVAEIDEAAYDLRFAGAVGEPDARPVEIAVALRGLGAPGSAAAYERFMAGWKTAVGELGGK